MAHRPQQLVRIMETPTRFDLTTAIENWRQELAQQPGLLPDDCRELANHLQDSVEQLQRLGLPAEEAFWLARRRLGQLPAVSSEFAKENPAAIWRERLLWVAVAVLGLQLWESACFSLSGPFALVAATLKVVPPWLNAVVKEKHLIGNEFIFVLTALCFAVRLRRGQMPKLLSAWESLTASRARFLSLAIPSVLLLFGLQNCSILPLEMISSPRFYDFGYMLLLNTISPLAMVCFIAWLLPARQNGRLPLPATQ